MCCKCDIELRWFVEVDEDGKPKDRQVLQIWTDYGWETVDKVVRHPDGREEKV